MCKAGHKAVVPFKCIGCLAATSDQRQWHGVTSGSMWIGFQERCWIAARRILVAQDCPDMTVACGKSLPETREIERSFVGQDPAPKLSTSANSWAPASFNNVAQVLEHVKLLLNASASRARGTREGTNTNVRIQQIGWISNGFYWLCESTWGMFWTKFCLSHSVIILSLKKMLFRWGYMECRGTQLSGTACKDREVTTGTDCNNGASAKNPCKFPMENWWKIPMISWKTLGVDSAPRLCEDWWFGNGTLGSTKKNGRYSDRIQSYLSTHGKPRLVPLILTIRLDVLRNIPVHYLYDVVTLNKQRNCTVRRSQQGRLCA